MNFFWGVKSRAWIFILIVASGCNLAFGHGSCRAAGDRDPRNNGNPRSSSLNSEFVNYFHQDGIQRYIGNGQSADRNRLTGYIPSPLSPEKHKTSPIIKSSAQSAGADIGPRYDMRDPNDDGDMEDSLLTPVKEQHAGNCWAYATYGSLESQLKQFSNIEENLSVDRLTTEHGFDRTGYDGGNIDMSAAYLSRHDGPTNDYDAAALRYVDDIIYFPVRANVHDNHYIKEAVKTYGGLYTAFQWSASSYNPSERTYYYDDPDDSYNDANHAVVIVGWDDYKVVSGAPGAGAYIVRNSWGQQWGDGGYFYVSYYDESFAFISLAGFSDKAESFLEFDEVYFHDLLGCLTGIGYMSSTAWGANRFVPEKNELLKAVSFFALRAEMTYEITIYDELTNGVLAQQRHFQSGELKYGGWHTIILDQQIPLERGNDYFVAVKFITRDYGYPIPVEMPIENYASNAKANPEESFISGDGNSWRDVTDYFSDANICIKAFVSGEQPSQGNYGARHFFPQISSAKPWQSEICILNTSTDQRLEGQLIAYDNTGRQVGSPQTVDLPPNGRKEVLAGSAFERADTLAYVVLETDRDTVAGYSKLYIQGRYRAAVPMADENLYQDIHIPHIASNENWWTSLSFLNTTSGSKDITIEFNTGQIITRTIGAGEQQCFLVKALFNEISQTDIQSAVVRNAQGVVGTALFGNTDSSKNSFLSGILIKGDAAMDLYYPHLVGNDKWWTGIVAYNPNNTPCNFSVAAYAQDGTILSLAQRKLQPRAKFVGTRESLKFPDETAWLSIHAESPLMGFELFGTNDGKQLSGYTSVNIIEKKALFAKIDTEGWTGICFVNAQPEIASIHLSVYKDNGDLVATQWVELAAYEKKMAPVEHLFSHGIDGATHISYLSDIEIVGFQLNGSSDHMLLDGLPGLH